MKTYKRVIAALLAAGMITNTLTAEISVSAHSQEISQEASEEIVFEEELAEDISISGDAAGETLSVAEIPNGISYEENIYEGNIYESMQTEPDIIQQDQLFADGNSDMPPSPFDQTDMEDDAQQTALENDLQGSETEIAAEEDFPEEPANPSDDFLETETENDSEQIEGQASGTVIDVIQNNIEETNLHPEQQSDVMSSRLEKESNETVPEQDEGDRTNNETVPEQDEADSMNNKTEPVKDEADKEIGETDKFSDNAENEDLKTYTSAEFAEPEKYAAEEQEEYEYAEVAEQQSAADGEAGQRTWSFDAYYINEADLYDVTKVTDFSLKYQLEFHTSQTLEAGAVVITVPRKLFDERAGSERAEVLPDDISVLPADTEGLQTGRDHFATVAAILSEQGKKRWNDQNGMHFNYYVDIDGNLVFFNYEEIGSGSSLSWQVLYKRLYQMDIIDGTEWSLDVTARVRPYEAAAVQEQKRTLTGRTDSTVVLSSVSKTAAQIGMQQYTPGLYTPSQVQKYISTYADDSWKDILGDSAAFNQYRYVVWDVSIKGSGNQPWNLFISDLPTYRNDETVYNGTVVGFIDNSKDGSSCIFEKASLAELDQESWCIRRSNPWDEVNVRFYVVTAYPADIQDGDLLSNDITAALQPVDLIDPVQIKSAHAEWNYRSYHWNYHGEIIGVEKFNRYTGIHEQNYFGWLKRYEAFREKGKDAGDLPFESHGYCLGYVYTHNLNRNGGTYGEYVNGSYYRITYVDDAVYAFCGDRQVLLTDADYYFDEVEFFRQDYGYDIWEARTVQAEHPESLDQTMIIYAMFEGSSTWEAVGTAAFTDYDQAKYTFTEDQIARHPYRVKAEYNACSYKTDCTAYVSVCLKQDSPVITAMLYENGKRNAADVLQIENLSGIAGQVYGVGDMDDGSYFQDTAVDGSNGHGGTNYSEPGLVQFTRSTYGTILMRDCALKVFTDLHPHAAAAKTAKITNDPNHKRVLVRYDLTQYDGYDVYAESLIPYLKDLGITSPGLQDVVWYDLFPAGMEFDASGKIIAGRISELKSDYRSWDTTQISVTVDAVSDVTPNWRGTGRTMVALHIHYTGVDSARYIDGLWAEGFAVSFQAYYTWESITAVDNPVNTNIAAFMPDKGAATYRELAGKEEEVYPDDGSVPETGGYLGYFDSGDLNNDGVTNVRNVLYAKAWVSDDVAVAAKDTIVKKVRADTDVSAPYTESTSVLGGGTYTYAMTVSTASGMRDLVIFDRLEHALEDRKDIPNETFPMESASWHGTFAGMDVSEARLMGIIPVVYYNENRDAEQFIPSSQHKPQDVDLLLQSSGWMTEAAWLAEGKALSDVKAVAVDLRQSEDGSFELGKGQTVTIRIHMQAPETVEPTWAYNNPSFFATVLSDTSGPVTAFVVGNSVRVALGRKKTLEVMKKCTGTIPEEHRDDEFIFRITSQGQPFSNRIYRLLWMDDKAAGTVDDALHATDVDGRFKLKAGQKAVFADLPYTDEESFTVTEEENIFWESEQKITETEDTIRQLFFNTFRPIVFVRKVLAGIPEGLDPEIKKEIENSTFTFYLLDEKGIAVPDAEFWYVKESRTDGSSPAIDTSRGNLGTGRTDADGSFRIHAGDIIAIRLRQMGQQYTIKEKTAADLTDIKYFTVQDENGENWIVRNPEAAGTADKAASTAVITNIYRWKNLELYKAVQHRPQAAALADDTIFTFRLMEADGTPVAGREYAMEREGGLEPVAGRTDENGCFSAPCAGRTIVIKGLEAGRSYTVQETSAGEGSGYVFVNDGKITAVMPLYAGKKKAVITNSWTMRPLYISKMVVTDLEELQDAALSEQFTFTVSLNGSVYAHEPFGIRRNGKSVVGKLDAVTVISAGWPAGAADGSASGTDAAQTVTFPGASFVQVRFAEGSRTAAESSMIRLQGGSQRKPYLRQLQGEDIGGAVYIIPGDTAEIAMSGSQSTGSMYCAELMPIDADGKVITLDNGILEPDREYNTDSEGQLQLRNGETAVFMDAGRNGLTSYEVTEQHQEGEVFTQVYPENNGASAGVIAGANTTAQFINGTKGVILLSKNYVVSADDADGLGAAALTDQLQADADDADSNIIEPVHFRLEYWQNNRWNTISSTEFRRLAISRISSDGTIRKVTSSKEKTSIYTEKGLSMPVGVSYMISGGLPRSAVKMRVTETADDRERVFWFENTSRSGYVYAGVSSPDSGTRIVEDVTENPVIMLTNKLEGLEEKSVIYKKLRGLVLPEEEIKLQFYVERYTGSGWEPASDIPCFERYDDQKAAFWQTSDEAGGVTMEIRGGEIPALVFPYHTVTINPSDPEPGTLRITESAGLQSGWGTLQGYISSADEDETQVSLGKTDADTFVNDNRAARIRIGKKLQTGSGADDHQAFIFRLEQIIRISSGKTFDQLKPDDLLELCHSSGISYEVYRIEDEMNETGSPVRIGTVGTDNTLQLYAGEYAELQVTQGTLWRVQEVLNVSGYSISDIQGNQESTARVVGGNTAILCAEDHPLVTLHYNDDTQRIQNVEVTEISALPDPEKAGLVKNGYDFTGWYLDPACQQAASGKIVTDMTLYAGWRKNHTVKYAVQLYGICQDHDREGHALGLTFGPALRLPVKTGRSHKPGSGKLCLHSLSWTEIAEQSLRDPYVFSECLENGCTHSVNIMLNDTLLQKDYWGSMQEGDGAGVLLHSIKPQYRMYNGEASNAGGWPASLIRSVLNGADAETNRNAAGDNVLPAAAALLSCFPEELQNSIAAREVRSDTVWNSRISGTVTTYDKLWLPAEAEIYSSSEAAVRTNEGAAYTLMLNKGITLTSSGANLAYNEERSSESRWLRSISTVNGSTGVRVAGGGAHSLDTVTRAVGLAPGFCLR